MPHQNSWQVVDVIVMVVVPTGRLMMMMVVVVVVVMKVFGGRWADSHGEELATGWNRILDLAEREGLAAFRVGQEDDVVEGS